MRRCPTAAILSAMNMETMQMLVTPGKEDLQDRMQVCQGGMAVHQHSTPDEWANAAQDDAELIDAEWCSSGNHVLRVAQRSVPLKRSPRYLALSWTTCDTCHLAILPQSRVPEASGAGGELKAFFQTGAHAPGVCHHCCRRIPRDHAGKRVQSITVLTAFDNPMLLSLR